MFRKFWLLAILIGPIAGCGTEKVQTEPVASSLSSGTSEAESAATATADIDGSDAVQGTVGNVVMLSPANTTIEFVGKHPGADPKPRHCSFQDFAGKAMVEGELKAVEVDIKTTSLTSEIDNLTAHLKNVDFFDVNQHPTARFVSTSIATSNGTAEITGELTLLGQTHPVKFPAEVSTDGGLKLKAAFQIDRTIWGMNYDATKVEKLVDLTITIGG